MPGYRVFYGRAGTALLFNSYGMHTSMLNRSTTPRRSIILIYEKFTAGQFNPERFARKAGADQQLKDFKPSKFTWLEPYCALEACTGEMRKRLEAYRPLNNYRVGGDLTALFGPPQAT